jgi:hypothetical protein
MQDQARDMRELNPEWTEMSAVSVRVLEYTFECGGAVMMKLAARLSLPVAAAVVCAAMSVSALAQTDSDHKGSLALPMPAPVAAPSAMPSGSDTASPTETTHSRSAHRSLKLDLPVPPKTEVEPGNSPLQGAGPPQANPPVQVAAQGGQQGQGQGSGPLLLSPLQGAGPVSAREMLLGSASSLGTR